MLTCRLAVVNRKIPGFLAKTFFTRNSYSRSQQTFASYHLNDFSSIVKRNIHIKFFTTKMEDSPSKKDAPTTPPQPPAASETLMDISDTEEIRPKHEPEKPTAIKSRDKSVTSDLEDGAEDMDAKDKGISLEKALSKHPEPDGSEDVEKAPTTPVTVEEAMDHSPIHAVGTKLPPDTKTEAKMSSMDTLEDETDGAIDSTDFKKGTKDGKTTKKEGKDKGKATDGTTDKGKKGKTLDRATDKEKTPDGTSDKEKTPDGTSNKEKTPDRTSDKGKKEKVLGSTTDKEKTPDRMTDKGKTPERKTEKPMDERMTSRVINKEAERYLNMTLKEKRKVYKCGDNYVQLTGIKTWDEHSRKMKKAKVDHVPKKFLPNPEYNKRISLWKGDITALEIDAIVNAANNSLMGGGGVDGAIHYAAGSSLKEECRLLRGCETGDAKRTHGYKLPAKYIIHTVGPIGENSKALRNCYRRCLEEMQDPESEVDLRSIAFPCISTGIYGYDNEAAANVALKTLRDMLDQHELDLSRIERIIFCIFLKIDEKIYTDLLPLYFPVEDSPEQMKMDEESEMCDKAGGSPRKTHKDEDHSKHSKKPSTTDDDQGPIKGSKGSVEVNPAKLKT